MAKVKLVPPSVAELKARGLNPDGTPIVKDTPKATTKKNGGKAR